MDAQGSARSNEKPAERRTNTLLRNHFDSALTLLEPLLINSTSLNGTSLYRAMNRLHSTYPDLSSHEIEALVAVVVRTLQNRREKIG